MSEPQKGDWVNRPGRVAHRITTVSVSRASRPIGYWVRCGRHLGIVVQMDRSRDLRLSAGGAQRCKQCLNV